MCTSRSRYQNQTQFDHARSASAHPHCMAPTLLSLASSKCTLRLCINLLVSRLWPRLSLLRATQPPGCPFWMCARPSLTCQPRPGATFLTLVPTSRQPPLPLLSRLPSHHLQATVPSRIGKFHKPLASVTQILHVFGWQRGAASPSYQLVPSLSLRIPITCSLATCFSSFIFASYFLPRKYLFSCDLPALNLFFFLHFFSTCL